MGRVQYVFGIILFALICLKNSAAISCYECNSSSDKRCLADENNKLAEEMKKPCPERKGKQFSLCRKIKQVIDFEVNGLKPDSRTIRTCGYDDLQYKNRCYQRSGFGGRQEVCACDTDDCNGSTTILSSISLITGLLILLRFQN